MIKKRDMRISDLKLNEKVQINGFEYVYKGVQKIKKPNFGKIEQIVFERNAGDHYDYKYFDLKVRSRELKQDKGILIF